MTEQINKFWRGVFSEDDGSPSFSRVFSAFVICHVCGWISCAVVWLGYLAFKNKIVPDTTSLVSLIGSLGGFSLSILGVTYGINKASTAYKEKGDKVS